MDFIRLPFDVALDLCPAFVQTNAKVSKLPAKFAAVESGKRPVDKAA